MRKSKAHSIFLLVLDCGFFAENAGELFGCKLEFAIIGHNSVLLLLNVSKLSIAECKNAFVFEKHVSYARKALKELIFSFNRSSVSPGTAVVFKNPFYSSVFAYKNGKSGVVKCTCI